MIHRLDPKTTVAICGYRPCDVEKAAFGYPDDLALRLELMMRLRLKEGYTHFLSGMEPGFEIMACEAAYRLRKDHRQICLVPVLAYPQFAHVHQGRWRKRYKRAVSFWKERIYTGTFKDSQSDKRRNDFLVKNSSYALIYFDGVPGHVSDFVKKAVLCPDPMRHENLCYPDSVR